MVIGAVLSIAIMASILLLPNLSYPSLVALFLLLGFVTSAQVISYPTIAEGNPRYATATSVSIVSFTTIGGYAVFQPLFGYIMDSHWTGQMVNGIREYGVDAYRTAIMIIPIALVVGLLAALFIKETNCTFIEDKQESL